MSPLKSLILFTSWRPEEGIPGKETEGAIYERTGTVPSGQELPKGCTLSAINLEFSVEQSEDLEGCVGAGRRGQKGVGGRYL